LKTLRLAVLLALAALPLAAQMSVDVRVIEVPVTVTDRDGNPIRGLTAANFQVLDDGKPQTITSFDNIDFAARQDVTAISPLNPNARRSFLLLFDIGYSDVKAITRAREAATSFVKTSVQPRDLVAVGSVDPEKGFRLHTAFTTDRKIVAAAIAQPGQYQGNDPLQLSDVDAFTDAQGSTSGSEMTGSGNAAAADSHLAEIKEMTRRNNRDFVAGRVMREIQSLGLLASTLRSVPGRKQVVLLSAGFDPSIVRGKHGSELADMAKATSGQAYLIDNDARFGNTASQNVLDEMVKLFKQSDVVMHAIDIGGLRLAEEAAVKGYTANDGLHLIADPTGGKVYENSNALSQNLDRMLHQQEVVYVLGFHAQPSKPGKLHDLSVKLVDGPPGAKVSNRVAYYEGTSATPAERRLTDAEIVVNDIPQSEIQVAALATALPGSRQSAAVPLFLEINGESLLKGATKPVPADIYVYAFDEGGIVRDRIYQRITVDPARASGKVRGSGIKFFTTLALPPGRYAVKSLVSLPESERRGFVRTELVVPDGGDMAVLPPLFRDPAGQWALIKGVQHGAAAYPFLLDGEPFLPSAAPHLRKSEPGEFALFLYNANPEELMMQATVTDAAGVTRPAQPSLVRQIKGEGVTKLVFHVDPSGIAAGPARFDLLLHKKGSPDVRKASLPVVVVN
jgi:VWFA-related protein